MKKGVAVGATPFSYAAFGIGASAAVALNELTLRVMN